MFDTTCYPQCKTDPKLIEKKEGASDFVHYGYVISTYRWFQRSRGPFEDTQFCLLLIRLLIDTYDDSGWNYALPSLPDLVRGYKDPSARVTYCAPETRIRYSEFREKLQRLIDGGILDPRRVDSLRRGIGHFDQIFQENGKTFH